jgi:hypothetical protein
MMELLTLCVKLFPVIIHLHAIIRNNPTQIQYNIEDQQRIMGVDVAVKKSPYSEIILLTSIKNGIFRSHVWILH